MAKNEIDAQKRAISFGTQTATKNEDHDWEPIAGDDPRALLPAGDYQVLCTRAVHRSYAIYHRHAIVLSLQIYEEPYAGIVIERFYNMPADRNVPRGSDYFREWILANDGVKPHRRERMYKKKFLGKLFKASVVTVTVNSRGIELGAAAYSKAARLNELLTTNEQVK